jgi:erythromycin esterase-like protein
VSDEQGLPALSQLAVRTGRLEPGHATCFALRIQKGEFVRASLAVDKEYVRLRLLDPQTRNARLTTWAWSWETYGRPPAVLAFEAPVSGTYVVELSVPAMPWSSAVAGPFRLQIDEWLSSSAQANRRDELRRDPRTAWLRRHAIAVRSIDPADDNFSDLQFLRDQLRSVRVVLLGEGSAGHGGGSEQHAKARLVKFLHREMGFDVLAIEAGLFGTSLAWRGLQAGEDPRTAYLRGAYRNASLSSHVQPLIQYLAAAARTPQPLELVGFDTEFSGTAPRAFLLQNLRGFLSQIGVRSPLADASSAASRILGSMINGDFGQRRAQLLVPGETSDLPQVLRATATEVERAPGSREAMFWAQVLRSAAGQAEDVLGQTPPAWTRDSARDRRMAENLVWLVQSYFPTRKIIVWAHTTHVVRHAESTTLIPVFSAGQALWEAVGEESFVIGTTAYAGAAGCVVCTDGMKGLREDIATDQDASFEFEELMNAAGHELAWVNLRAARSESTWLGGRFLARPIYAVSRRAPWSDVLDALLFIRTQEPNSRVPDAFDDHP